MPTVWGRKNDECAQYGRTWHFSKRMLTIIRHENEGDVCPRESLFAGHASSHRRVRKRLVLGNRGLIVCTQASVNASASKPYVTNSCVSKFPGNPGNHPGNLSGHGRNFLRHFTTKFYFHRDLFAKELCRECVCCLVPSLLHTAFAVLRGRVAEWWLSFREQHIQLQRHGIFKSRLFLEPFRHGTEEGADGQ